MAQDAPPPYQPNIDVPPAYPAVHHSNVSGPPPAAFGQPLPGVTDIAAPMAVQQPVSNGSGGETYDSAKHTSAAANLDASGERNAARAQPRQQIVIVMQPNVNIHHGSHIMFSFNSICTSCLCAFHLQLVMDHKDRLIAKLLTDCIRN